MSLSDHRPARRPRPAPAPTAPADTRVPPPADAERRPGRDGRLHVPADRPALARAARRHRAALPVGARRVRLGQLLLLRRRPGRVGVVEGVLLRLLRRRERDHRRQDAAGAVADGAVGADLRALVVEHPRAPGARGRRRGRRCCTPRCGVRRDPAVAGLIAGAVLALTPVAVLMFRFNNPDALLVLLLVGCGVRHPAGDRVVARRAASAGPLARPRRRAGRAGVPDQDAAGVPGAAGAGRWCSLFAGVAAGGAGSCTCWPRSARCSWPPAGGSRSSSCGRRPRAPTSAARRTTRILELTLGYNGLGRLDRRRDRLGRRRRRRRRRKWGATGLLRMFGSEVGSQVAWLLPAALVLCVAGAVVRPWLARAAWSRPG